MAVIAAFDLDDLFATSGTTCNADGVHGGFGAAVGETPHRQAVASAEHLGDFRVGLAWRDEQGAVVELPLDSRTNRWVTVTREQRPETHVVVGVAIAVDIFHPAALSAAHHNGMRVIGLKAGRHAHGHHLASTFGSRLRTLCA